jgi:hypothetical protein
VAGRCGVSDEREQVRAAALGQSDWGVHGSARHHRRYIEELPKRFRRRCDCGCETRASHVGMANGVALTSGCELSMRRWAR